MKILPPVMRPWSARIDRRHSPPSTPGRESYRRFRQCLRWEFGFTCPFCLCHEADLALDCAEGSGLTQIEHWIPISSDPGRAGDYKNCFYICRYCNRARSAAPIAVEGGEGRLLSPCSDIWQESFSLAGDELEPRRDDTAAAYTLATYDLNDPRKTARRRRRRKVIRARLAFIEQAERARERLLEKGIRNREPELVDLAGLLEQALRRAWQDLERFRVVPADAQCPCACGDEELCEIPDVLREQIQEVVRESGSPA